jgi:type II secretory pathway pseudopilin PulG
VLESSKTRRDSRSRALSGFSLLEMMISMVILLGITGIVMTAMLQTTRTEGTVQNRTEMHASVRSATELLQQEIGQAGRVALPPVANIQMTTAITAAGSATPTLTAGATAGMFPNEYLVVDAGSNQETVQISSITGNTITANFGFTHAANVPVTVQGGFGTGVVPESAAPYNMANGSDGTHLKLYGDINGDGNMVYVEYVCDYAASGNLYRSISAYNAANIVAKQVLLPNLVSTGNPGGTPCFVYQERPVGCNSTATNPCFVTDVAVTLTVQTQLADPSTGLYQKETKALLNVSPRNVFDAYELSTLSNNRVQPMPATVTALLSQTP